MRRLAGLALLAIAFGLGWLIGNDAGYSAGLEEAD